MANPWVFSDHFAFFLLLSSFLYCNLAVLFNLNSRSELNSENDATPHRQSDSRDMMGTRSNKVYHSSSKGGVQVSQERTIVVEDAVDLPEVSYLSAFFSTGVPTTIDSSSNACWSQARPCVCTERIAVPPLRRVLCSLTNCDPSVFFAGAPFKPEALA